MNNDDSPAPRGFEFPGQFELSAIGTAEGDFGEQVVLSLENAGILADRASLRRRPSAKGNYVSVAISFAAASREQYDAAHEALRACPGVKWTL